MLYSIVFIDFSGGDMTNFKYNLVKKDLVKKIINISFFPYVFQVLTLFFLFLLVVNGFLTGIIENDSSSFIKIIRKTNFTTLFVWGVWWPFLVISTILFGRIWCLACPTELLNNISYRVSRKLGIKGFTMPKWIRAGYFALFSYLILQFLVAGFDIHRIPLYSSIVLLTMFIMAILSGIIFKEHRSYCYGFCPAVLLLNAYSKISPFVLSRDDDDTCYNCKTKECVSPKNLNNHNKRSCPSYLRPYNLDANDNCVICFQCAKSCPSNNIGYGLKKEGKISDSASLTMPSALFVIFALGFVSHELFGENTMLDEIFHYIPQKVSAIVNVPFLFPWIEAIWFLLIIP